jgi:hypothetical protein
MNNERGSLRATLLTAVALFVAAALASALLLLAPTSAPTASILSAVTAGCLGAAIVVATRAFLSTASVSIAGSGSGSHVDMLQRVTATIDRRLLVAEQAAKVGLAECHVDCNVYDFTNALSDSRTLTVMLNDGRTWTSVHRDRLRRRFEDATRTTTIFLVHPQSAMISVLARKGSIEPEVLRSRISETLTLLDEICLPTTQLEVLGHHLFNPHSLVLTDRSAMIIPYSTSRGRRTQPLLAFEDIGGDCFYRQVAADMERLRMDSDLLKLRRGDAAVSSSVLPFRVHGTQQAG